MIKQSLVTLSFLGTALAHAQKSGEIVNTTYTTTFSHYGNLSNVLSCQPGMKGGYAIPDTLSLRSHAVELGVDIHNNEDLIHLSFEAVERERRNGVGPGEFSDRPYSEGCKPLMERIQTEIDGKELVWVTVSRRVNRYFDNVSIVQRDINGEVKNVRWNKVRKIMESVTVDLAGFKFTKIQEVNVDVKAY